MRSVEQIIVDAEKLSTADFRRLADWIADRDQEIWDAEIARYSAAGKLDRMAEEALEEHRLGLTRPI